jgi:hypothetical protein
MKMNISMLDMFSLAWKINLIEKGIGKRETIIETYEQERRGVAQELLTMDAEYSKHFSGQGGTINGLDKAQQATKVLGVDPQLFMQLFKKSMSAVYIRQYTVMSGTHVTDHFFGRKSHGCMRKRLTLARGVEQCTTRTSSTRPPIRACSKGYQARG